MTHRVHRPAPGEALPATGVAITSTTQCQWCGVECGTPTEHMVHVTLEHPEAIGRGRTRSATWTCGCGTTNPPSTGVCTHCGALHWSSAT